MSLDMTEFVVGVEEAFGVRIPNDVAPIIFTPRHLAVYLQRQLPQSLVDQCLSQRAFYRIRRALVERIRTPRSVLRPATELLSVLPAPSVWAEVGKSLGWRRWPAVRGSWLARTFQSPGLRTLGEAARYVSSVVPRVLKSEGEGWSRREVVTVIDGQIRHHFGITDYSPDDKFEDLGWS